MNSIFRNSKVINRFALPPLLLATVLWILPTMHMNGATVGKTFASPTDAVKAFATAVENRDSNALANIFGPNFKELESPDPVQTKEEIATLAERIKEGTRLERNGNNQYTVDIGRDQWPFAVPIVQQGGAWFFDTDAGKEEVINRRIGRNELDALKSVRAYNDAQRLYASKDRNGDQVLEYAQKFVSSPGKKDGLYWSPDLGEESPLGPLFVQAHSEGYRVKNVSQNANAGQSRQPFHGYYFKILTRQGKSAPGGAYDYIINGHMIGGFGLVAWPAEYGETGVMTFIINQQGKVYQKDLGKNTESIAENMTTYNPDSSWTLSPE
ncbi:MAG: DUF2950 domain-containing protein [Limisphaerales bacterium]